MDVTKIEIEGINAHLAELLNNARVGSMTDHERAWSEGYSDATKQGWYRLGRLVRLADKCQEDLADCPPEDTEFLRGYCVGIRRSIAELLSVDSQMDPSHAEEMIVAAVKRVGSAPTK